MTTALQKERVAKGLCPRCGKEAAPYYLCHDCRFTNKIVRILNRGAKAGGFKKEMRGREAYWSVQDKGALERITWRPDPKEGDRRLDPRLRGVRVDVDATLINVIRFIGRPCTIEEIMAGWGSLRSKRDAPLANDLGRIIAAKDKRERKAAKRREMDGV